MISLGARWSLYGEYIWTIKTPGWSKWTREDREIALCEEVRSLAAQQVGGGKAWEKAWEHLRRQTQGQESWCLPAASRRESIRGNAGPFWLLQMFTKHQLHPPACVWGWFGQSQENARLLCRLHVGQGQKTTHRRKNRGRARIQQKCTLNCMLYNGENGKFHIMCLSSQLRKRSGNSLHGRWENSVEVGSRCRRSLRETSPSNPQAQEQGLTSAPHILHLT